jgi:methionyl-tRNA formyltransferase
MIRIRIRFSRLARQFHNQAPSQRFNILYFGRDEFSCEVLEKLHSATGATFPLSSGPLPRTRIDASSPADVWQNILIATQPDQMIGRKRDILSVCQSPSLPLRLSYSSASLAPLKTLGDELKLPVTTIPQIRSELKTWTVHPTSFFLTLALQKINPLSPPSPRHPSIPWPACRLHPITSCSLHHSDASFPPAFSHFLDRRTPSMYTHPLYQPTAALRPSSGPS